MPSFLPSFLLTFLLPTCLWSAPSCPLADFFLLIHLSFPRLNVLCQMVGFATQNRGLFNQADSRGLRHRQKRTNIYYSIFAQTLHYINHSPIIQHVFPPFSMLIPSPARRPCLPFKTAGRREHWRSTEVLPWRDAPANLRFRLSQPPRRPRNLLKTAHGSPTCFRSEVRGFHDFIAQRGPIESCTLLTGTGPADRHDQDSAKAISISIMLYHSRYAVQF